MPDITPTKKGKIVDNSKGKYAMLLLKAKKKATWKFNMPPTEATSTCMTIVVVEEGTSANPIATLGPKVTMLRIAATTEKILKAAIPPLTKRR